MQKLLRLLMVLGGIRRYTLAELAERFELSERTIYRYLELFESSGFVLNRKDGYSLQTNTPAYKSFQKLLHFSDDEAYLLYHTLSELEGSSPVKERLIRKLNVLYDFHVLKKKPADQLRIVHTVGHAIEKKLQVDICDYRSSHSGTVADRAVEPFAFLPDYAAVWCYDNTDKICKQFHISRMKEVNLLPHRWQNTTALAVLYSAYQGMYR